MQHNLDVPQACLLTLLWPQHWHSTDMRTTALLLLTYARTHATTLAHSLRQGADARRFFDTRATEIWRGPLRRNLGSRRTEARGRTIVPREGNRVSTPALFEIGSRWRGARARRASRSDAHVDVPDATIEAGYASGDPLDRGSAAVGAAGRPTRSWRARPCARSRPGRRLINRIAVRDEATPAKWL